MSKKLYDFINYPIGTFTKSPEFKRALNKVLCCTNSGGGGIQSVVAGTNITVDNTDPLNPIVSATTSGLSGSGTNNTLTKWTGTSSLGDSLVSEDTTTVKIGAVGSQPTYAFGVYGTTNGVTIGADQNALNVEAGNTSTVSALIVSRSNTSANIAEFSASGSNTVNITSTGSVQASALVGTGTRVTLASSTGLLSALANGTDTHVLTLVAGVPTWAAGGGGGISGLTTNYLTKATSSTTIGNSLVFDNGSSVGIGTATPTAGYIFDVVGKIKTTQIIAGSTHTFSTAATTAHVIGEQHTVEAGSSFVTVIGGYLNTIKASAYISTIAGGSACTVDGTNNHIVASIGVNFTGVTGQNNYSVASKTCILFGGGNSGNRLIGANGSYVNTGCTDNIVMGFNNFAQHNGCFMLGDLASVGAGYLNSSMNNQFIARYQNGFDFKLANNLSAMLINASGQVGIGTTTPNASAILDVTSTTQGVLFPRVTTTQKNAIASPTAGLVVYDTTLNKLCVYTTAWETITSI